MDDNKQNFDIAVINFNNYVIPDSKLYVGKKYVLNGDNNSFFTYLDNCYNGSPTHAGIVNAYTNYIIGEGLIDRTGINIYKYISKRDIKNICHDFKLFGQFSLQVIWSQGSKLLEEKPTPLQIKYIPTYKLGINVNTLGEIDGYWYSFDWENQSKYKPKLFAKYDGIYKKNAIEIITIDRISSKPYFPHPDYISGVIWSQIEEELGNTAINHIANGFSNGTIVTAMGGIPATEELREEYKRKILSKLTGSTNKNKTIVAFTDELGNGSIKVENLQVDQLDAVLVYYSEQAQKQLLQAHGVVNPVLFGVRDGQGLSPNKDEMAEALKVLYRSSINPMREVILDGLEYVLRDIDSGINLYFKDFEDLSPATPSDEKNNEI